MSYTITIDQSDITAFDFIGRRYDCGSELLMQIVNNAIAMEYQDTNIEDPDYSYGFTATIPEHTAWDISDRMNNDTENMTTNHPLLAGSLWAKLTALYDSIV